MALFPLLLTFGAFRPLSTHNDFLGSFRKTSAEISIPWNSSFVARVFPGRPARDIEDNLLLRRKALAACQSRLDHTVLVRVARVYFPAAPYATRTGAYLRRIRGRTDQTE